jgi:hypothetical protein
MVLVMAFRYVCVCTIHLPASFCGGSSGSLAALNDSVQSLRSELPYQHGGVESGLSEQLCMAHYKAVP